MNDSTDDQSFDLEPCIALTDPGDEWGWVEFGVGPSNEAVVLCARFDDVHRFYERGGGGSRASFARTKTERPIDALALVQAENGEHRTLPLCGLNLAFPRIQVFSNGDVLVAGGRCRYADGGPEHNAAIFGADGSITATGCLGDGIRDVLVAPDDTIWVSYLDEGVFGNFGWGDPGPAPIGARGLVAFDRSFAPVFEFRSSDGLKPIWDCYALTLEENTPWISYYGGGSIVRLSETPRAWERGPLTATTLVASDNRVGVFARGERGFLVGSLSDDRLEIVGQGPLRMPDGYEQPARPSYAARNGSLFVFTESLAWFRLTLADAFAQLSRR